MGTMELSFRKNYEISEIDKNEIDSHIDKLIEKYKNDTQKTTLWTMESVSLATAVESRSDEIEGQNIMTRLFRSITGKNQKISAQNQQDLAKAQYLSQQMLNNLMKQNLIPFELLTVLNKKIDILSNDILKTNQKIQDICKILSSFINDKYKNLQSQVNELERNVDLIRWAETIGYDEDVFQGKGYKQLNIGEKLICIASDFYKKSKGKWNKDDLLTLKKAMNDAGINLDSKLPPVEIIKSIDNNNELLDRFFSEKKHIEYIDTEITLTPFLISFSKLKKLETEEKYFIDIMHERVPSINRNLFKIAVLVRYIKHLTNRNLYRPVSCYDLVIDLTGDLAIFQILISHHIDKIKIEHSETNTENESHDVCQGRSENVLNSAV